jgi:uncharacterized membrane protein
MSQLERQLDRWRQAGLLDAATAEAIRVHEASRAAQAGSWLARLALGAGGLMAAAGILLFVAANWDGLSPGARGAVLLGTLVTLHGAGGALADRLPALAATLHAVGTAALGAAVFLLGQTYHLEAEWPRGYLLWSLGAWAGWFLLRSWPQLLFAALLTPAWLVAEWLASQARPDWTLPLAGLTLLAFVYLLAERPGEDSAARRTLGIIGAIALLPLAAIHLLVDHQQGAGEGLSAIELGVGGIVAFGAPLALAAWLRGKAAIHALVMAAWVAVAGFLEHPAPLFEHAWGALGATLVVVSGVRDGNARRISIGFAGFALSVVVFYFASVLDRMGRAASLVAGGIIFLVAGAALERLRRRLVARAGEEPR